VAEKLSRRDFLKLAGGLTVAAGTAALSIPVFRGLIRGDVLPDLEQLIRSGGRDPIDYRKAKVVPTICFGCTTHCGVVGYVQDGRVRRIEGNPLDPNSQGKICSKANGMISYTYYPERLLYPIKRAGDRGSGKWKRIRWDEALAEIAERMKSRCLDVGHPERFVFHYGRDKTKGFTKRFTDAFGTPNRLNRRSICSSNRRVPNMSCYGRDFEWETQDLEHSQYVLNFGNNCCEAYQGGLFMMHRLQRARVDSGCKLITFEVRPSATASISDEYWPVFPGSDGAIAYAMCNAIIDAGKVDEQFWNRWTNVSLDQIKQHIQRWTADWAEGQSGVPASEIRRIALEFAAAAPRCTTIKARGSAKHYNGVGNDRGINLLDQLVGNIGRPGGMCLSSGRGWKKGRYGLWDLPEIGLPGPQPPKVAPFLPGTRAYEALPEAVKRKAARLDPIFQQRYFGELATPADYPLAWHWYAMRVGQLVQPYIQEGRAQVEVYMSYTYGASYGYPEASVCREVMRDTSLIPFHVAVDIGYSEHAALADIILPETTSLERWDAHSTNCYGLVPYTGIRQPLVPAAGEARSIQVILRDLARRIGGGMERYFDFDDPEAFYRQWYASIADQFGGGERGWQEFKRRGIWQDQDREKDYELYERPVPTAELKGATVADDKLIRGPSGKLIGIMMRNPTSGEDQPVRGFPTPSRKIQVQDDVFAVAARSVGLPPDDPNGAVLPTWFPIPGFRDRLEPEDGRDPDGRRFKRMVLTTFKWNVHTQGRSGQWKFNAEIVHTNKLFINPTTAADLELKDGDEVEVKVYRPKGVYVPPGGTEVVGSFRNQVRLLAGIQQRVICFAHHAGHWEHGAVARASTEGSLPAVLRPDAAQVQALQDRDIPDNIWWSRERGGPGNGVIGLNDCLPINPSVLVGGQNWFDNVVEVRKV